VLEVVEYPKPLVAAVNGPAIGVGVTMILPFDVRIASETAQLGLAFVKLGILPGLGSTHLLPRLVGRAKALELVLTARKLEAREALEIGLVNHVVPPEKLAGAARELAAQIAAHRPEVVAAAKAAVNYGAEHTMEEAMRNEERASAAVRERAAKR
jgi:methylglutaconyl-CoA hydratase